MTEPTETTHRGVRWRRQGERISFFDGDGERWVDWRPGADAPPLPPRWQILGVPTKVTRPAWRSPWRIVPIVLVLAATVIAVIQATAPSANNTAKEAKQSASLLGKCLPKNGNHGFSANTVPCDSAKAAVKVVAVISADGSTPCPDGSRGVEFTLAGVAHPHVECVTPVTTG